MQYYIARYSERELISSVANEVIFWLFYDAIYKQKAHERRIVFAHSNWLSIWNPLNKPYQFSVSQSRSQSL